MKLSALKIVNYCCFDDKGCEIRIDDIVVLIGQNNSGKSTILDAYEAFASSGTEMPLSYFKDENPSKPVEITGIFTDITEGDIETIGAKCVHTDPTHGECVKVMWKWVEPGKKGEKHTYNKETGKFEKGGAGGFDSLLASRIPVPIRIKPTDTPDNLEKAIIEILTGTVKEVIKKDKTRIAGVIGQLETLAAEFSKQMEGELKAATDGITQKLAQIFPTYSVEFQPAVGKVEVDKIIGEGSHIRIKQSDKAALPLEQQGTGIQRTFLWAAIASLAESGRMKHNKKEVTIDKPRILLVDEPESFLHPTVTRAAREALYKLAELENWQVMASTHSPVFIDVSKPHTTIVRVENDEKWNTKTYSTDKARFDGDELKRLAMIRACNPFVNEFFFVDKVILVEGETEQALFNTLMESDEKFKHTFHIVSCFGKANIPMFCRILNQFGISYYVVHDADSPKALRDGKWITNAMWTVNKNIIEEVAGGSSGRGKCVSHVPHFELHYFDTEVSRNKPNHALAIVNSPEFKTEAKYAPLRDFYSHIIAETHPGLYSDFPELNLKVAEWVKSNNPTPKEKWEAAS